MMYPFMTLDDDTEIVHSEMKPDGRVKVYLEKPDAEDCFHSAVCWLPGYDWQEVHGFTPEEIAPLFRGAGDNVLLPERFAAVVERGAD